MYIMDVYKNIHSFIIIGTVYPYMEKEQETSSKSTVQTFHLIQLPRITKVPVHELFFSLVEPTFRS